MSNGINKIPSSCCRSRSSPTNCRSRLSLSRMTGRAPPIISSARSEAGFTGIADAVIGLSGSPKDEKRRLQVTGRYIAEQDRALQSDPERLTCDDIGFWSEHTGKGDDNTQRKVIGMLQKGPRSLDDLKDASGKGRSSVYNVLRALKGDGIVLYDTKNGLYCLESGARVVGLDCLHQAPRRTAAISQQSDGTAQQLLDMPVCKLCPF